MIEIKDKNNCCGCNACGDICAHNAISFETDIEGFWYPKVDETKCTDCGLCEKICPIIHAKEIKHNDLPNSECYAAIHKNIEVRFDSTSGGLFSALAEKTYKSGGYVGGAIWTKDWGAQQFISSDKGDLEKLRSSKYIQSNAQGFYKLVAQLVKNDEQVLVCGTPCQMAALRTYLGKNYDNLIIVDFICRGVNSPKVFRKYIEYLEKRFDSTVTYFKAKNKELGWRQLTSKMVFSNNKVLYDTRDTSYFTIGYLSTNVYCRPSCYDCRFKGMPRMADITIADFWGAENHVGKDLDNDLGTSLVMLNSAKGKTYFESIKDKVLAQSISFDSILPRNPMLMRSLEAPIVDRTQFYQDLDTMPFSDIARKYIDEKTPAVKFSKKKRVKRILKYLFHLRKIAGWSIKTWYQNIYYNFFCPAVDANVITNNYITIYPHCVIDIAKNSQIKVEGIVRFGWQKIKGSHLESRLLIEDNAQLIFEGNTTIYYGADIEIFHDASIVFGGDNGANIGLTLISGENITIEKDVQIGRNVTIRDNNGNHFIARRGYKNTHHVHISQHAWLCEGCTLIGGAKVGVGAIVGAKALVSGKVPNFSMVSGNPAVVVDEDVYWKY